MFIHPLLGVVHCWTLQLSVVAPSGHPSCSVALDGPPTRAGSRGSRGRAAVAEQEWQGRNGWRCRQRAAGRDRDQQTRKQAAEQAPRQQAAKTPPAAGGKAGCAGLGGLVGLGWVGGMPCAAPEMGCQGVLIGGGYGDSGQGVRMAYWGERKGWGGREVEQGLLGVGQEYPVQGIATKQAS